MHPQDSANASSDATAAPEKPSIDTQPIDIQHSESSKSGKPAKSMQKALCVTWLSWIFYRLLIMPVGISFLSLAHPDIAGGIFWHGLILLPAFAFTPSMMSGKSPFALLIGSMFTLIYFGASGVNLFSRFYDPISGLLIVYGVDACFLLMINILIFKLLKRLPKMNG